MEILERLIEQRERQKISQRSMAKLLNMKPSKLNKLEKGNLKHEKGFIDEYAKLLNLEIQIIVK